MKFKSLLKCWHAIRERYEAFLRRSKTFPSVGGEFGRSVPVKTAPLTARIQVFVSKMSIFEGTIFVFNLFRIFSSLLNMNIKCVEILRVFENIFSIFKKK